MTASDKNNMELSQSVYDSLYTRNSSQYDGNKTVVADDRHRNIAFGNGMEQHGSLSHDPMQMASGMTLSQEHNVIGVLFSLSGNSKGEIFPVTVGENKIGCDTHCDICLLEASVSSEHAVLNVWQSNDDEADYCLNITDLDSYYGTFVDEVQVDYGGLSVRNNNVITIGRHYKLLVCLFNAEKHGLYTDPEFVPLAIANDNSRSGQAPFEPIGADFYTRIDDEDNRKHTVLCDHGTRY